MCPHLLWIRKFENHPVPLRTAQKFPEFMLSGFNAGAAPVFPAAEENQE
jgi:hypothetical protein